jgi:RimJ/RimL family protein N-acetyltransferase
VPDPCPMIFFCVRGIGPTPGGRRMGLTVMLVTMAEGNVVQLRPVREEDLWLFEQQASDPELGGEFNWSGFKSTRRARQLFEQDGMLGPDGGRLIVESNGDVAGNVNWGRATYGVPDWWCWNIGIALLPSFRGQGIGTIAQRELVRYLFRSTVAPRVEAYTDIKNVPEQRALEKIGFVREGVLRSVQFRSGEWRDMVMFSLIRSEIE